MKYLLAHDLGTSGNKATLFSTDGQLVKSYVESYGCHYFNNNWAEQNPEEWWQAVCVTSKKILERNRSFGYRGCFLQRADDGMCLRG